ncbi:MAG: hypothetical protein OXF74_02705 [Rhodobacteraceae bacterium]|nr:hypothetical protein [Paracoccaceae bacterium]
MASTGFRNLAAQAARDDAHEIAVQPAGDTPPKRLTIARLLAGFSKFSGAYGDLTGRPTLFSGAYSDLSGRPALGTAAARNVGGANGVAGLNGQGTLFANLFPSYIATDAEVTAAVEALKGGAPTDMDTLKELADAIGLRLRDRGGWSDSAYAMHDVVRRVAGGGIAFYLARTAVAAGNSAVTAPGTGSAWRTSWHRIGWTDGAPSSHTGAPSYADGVLTITDRGGTDHQVSLPLLSSASERVESIAFADLTNARTDVELTPTAGSIGTVLGDGGAEILSDISGNDFTLAPGLFLIDLSCEITAGSVSNARNASIIYNLRRSSDDMMFAGGSFTTTRAAADWHRVSTYAAIVVPAAAAVNFYIERSGGSASVNVRNIKAEIIRFGGPKGDRGATGPAGSLVEIGSANYTVLSNRYAAGAGGGIDISGVTARDVLAVRLDDPDIGTRLFWLLGEDINSGQSGGGAVSANTHFAKASRTAQNLELLYLGRDSNDRLLFASTSGFVDPAPLTLYRMGSTTVPALQPHISGFAVTSGNTSPVPGSLENDVYGVEWSIAQSSHAGPVRIVAFKGTAANPVSVSVLKTLADAEKAHGTASVTMPAITLAAGETATLRLEVYAQNADVSTELPRSYQDARITAHAAAAAAYHTGNLRYMAGETAAETAARITDFTGDTVTSASLPSRLTIAVPAAPAGAEWQLYLLAKSDQPQPAGFTSAGLPASASFLSAQDVTINSVAYKAYILRPGQRLTTADNGDFFGVTAP